MLLKCKDGKKFWRKKQLQKCPNRQGMAIFARSPKTRIFCKRAKGGPRKIFKNRPKSSPRMKGPKAHWRKWHYPLNSTHLRCKHWQTFWRKQRFQTCSNGQVVAIFGGHSKPPFSEKVERGDQGKFLKIAKKVAFV